MERFHRAQRQVLRALSSRLSTSSRIRGARPGMGARLLVFETSRSSLSLLRVSQNVRVDAGVGLQRIENVDVLVFVHAEHEGVGPILIVIVDLQPVALGFRKHQRNADSDWRRGNCALVDAVPLGVFVRALVDLAVRNADGSSLGGLHFHGFVPVVESQHSLDLPAFRVGHLDAPERAAVGPAQRATKTRRRHRTILGTVLRV